MREIDEITGIIVDAAFRVHSGLGPGLLESVYEAVLARDLERQGLRVERVVSLSIELLGFWADLYAFTRTDRCTLPAHICLPFSLK